MSALPLLQSNLERFGIVQLARTGTVALKRGNLLLEVCMVHLSRFRAVPSVQAALMKFRSPEDSQVDMRPRLDMLSSHSFCRPLSIGIKCLLSSGP